jgi:Tol biopolymer transport system component
MAWRSELCICDPVSGAVETVLRSERLIEAPNWTPDGVALIVNGDGRLFRVPLDRPELVEINTGFARRLNNDHGISPDGRTLAISDKTEFGESRIYTLPASGGTPKLVTERGPSYWHGWSPDGATLAYVGRQGATLQIFTRPVAGGPEVQMTERFDHCDGPDYSSDGKWLWFNGEVDGRVDLWRIPSSGGTPEKMTDDDLVNWFPHPSPKGGKVLYLAFPAGTRGHPRDLDVSLRLLDEADGSVRTLVELIGGQGTINVPCWAPEGDRFAFMRYARPEE